MSDKELLVVVVVDTQGDTDVVPELHAEGCREELAALDDEKDAEAHAVCVAFAVRDAAAAVPDCDAEVHWVLLRDSVPDAERAALADAKSLADTVADDDSDTVVVPVGRLEVEPVAHGLLERLGLPLSDGEPDAVLHPELLAEGDALRDALVVAEVDAHRVTDAVEERDTVTHALLQPLKDAELVRHGVALAVAQGDAEPLLDADGVRDAESVALRLLLPQPLEDVVALAVCDSESLLVLHGLVVADTDSVGLTVTLRD